MPDYHLYDKFIEERIAEGENRRNFIYYQKYSIGFLTRGCFRHCEFCVNRNYNQSVPHSPLSEFLDPSRPYICLLDDNFLACTKWKPLLQNLIDSGHPFEFKQGVDERLLTKEKCDLLFSARYMGDYIFAFDNLQDRPVIEEKLKLIRENIRNKKNVKFYCFTGYDRENKWDDDFWRQDIFDLFERIRILMKYNCLPYVMRYERYKESPYHGMYSFIAAWCNQPSFYRKKSLREFAAISEQARQRYMKQFEEKFPEIKPYLDMKLEEIRYVNHTS